jgi:hypothetical protein
MGLAGCRYPSKQRVRVYAVTDAAAGKMRKLVDDCESHDDDALKHFIDEAVIEARKSQFHEEETWREKDYGWGIVTNFVVDITEYLYGVSWRGDSAKVLAIVREPRADQDREVVITLITDQEYNDAITSGRWKPMDYDFEAADELKEARRAENERPPEPLPETTYAHTAAEGKDVEYLLGYTDDHGEQFEHVSEEKLSERIEELVREHQIEPATIRAYQRVELEIEFKVAVKIGGKT